MDMQPLVNKKGCPIPVRAWFAMAVLFMFMGIFISCSTIHDYKKDIATGKSNRVIIRAEHPYEFWIRNTINFVGGIGSIAFALLCLRGGYKQMKSDTSAASDKNNQPDISS